MSSAGHSYADPVNGDFEAIEGEPLPLARARRLKRRRQTLALAAGSHIVNIALLCVFAFAGTISPMVVVAFGVCVSVKVALFTAISESGISDRWKDHFLAGPYAGTTLLVMLGFTYAVPAVSVVFFCAMILIANVVAFRASPLRGVVACAVMTGGLLAVHLLSHQPIALPGANALERSGTVLTFVATLARVMFINIFASRLRDNLFRRSVALEVAYRRIEELAELDDLTGALNRRSITRQLDDEIRRHARSNAPCTVALIDLDWFKRINDRFGHLIGDEVLRTFAITIFANIRTVDKFGRYGGEEFLLVLPDTPHDAAVRMLDRLRSIVESLDWSAFSDGLIVTISAGVATLRPGETAEIMLARADRALYAAKDRGRNNIAAA